MIRPGISSLSDKEKKIFQKFATPEKIQGLLDTFHFNFEPHGETLMSPRQVLLTKKCHCMEGALLAAALLFYHGREPLLLDLRANKHDYDHCLALFQEKGCWGAISKTNHAALRYRDPIYKTPRELALSYFHEYFENKNGTKTLRSYSRPLRLLQFGTEWITAEDDVWYLSEALDKTPHFPLFPKGTRLRRADAIELRAGKITEWKK